MGMNRDDGREIDMRDERGILNICMLKDIVQYGQLLQILSLVQKAIVMRSVLFLQIRSFEMQVNEVSYLSESLETKPFDIPTTQSGASHIPSAYHFRKKGWSSNSDVGARLC